MVKWRAVEVNILARNKSAMKRARKAAERALRNRSIKSRLRTSVRRFEEALTGSGGEQATGQTLRQVVSLLDRAAAKGVIHRNAARRKKSRLMKRMARTQG